MIDIETLQYCQRRNPTGVARLKAFLGLPPKAPAAAVVAACKPQPAPARPRSTFALEHGLQELDLF